MTSAPTGGGGRALIKWILLGAALVLAIIYGNYQHTESVEKAKVEKRRMADISICRNEDDEWVKTPAKFYRNNEGACVNGTLPPPPSPQVIIQKVGKTKQLYRFADFPGCISVELHSDVEFYPKGGEVLITPPSPGKPWHDRPGTPEDKRGALPPGTFTVCKVDPSAWGIEIWN